MQSQYTLHKAQCHFINVPGKFKQETSLMWWIIRSKLLNNFIFYSFIPPHYQKISTYPPTHQQTNTQTATPSMKTAELHQIEKIVRFKDVNWKLLVTLNECVLDMHTASLWASSTCSTICWTWFFQPSKVFWKTCTKMSQQNFSPYIHFFSIIKQSWLDNAQLLLFQLYSNSYFLPSYVIQWTTVIRMSGKLVILHWWEYRAYTLMSEAFFLYNK